MIFPVGDAATSRVADGDIARGGDDFTNADVLSVNSSRDLLSLAFVDRAIADIDTLLQGIEASQVVVIERGENGVAKIAETLLQYSNLASVQVFSHGREGQLQLGNTQLNAETLDVHADDVTQWGRSLSPSGDLLLYGCDVAAGAGGHDFITQMGLLTEADVAASTNLTGAGGDWTLEATYGQIEADVALSAVAQAA